MTHPPFFDQICSGLPHKYAGQAMVRDDIATKIKTRWTQSGIKLHQHDADNVAIMLVSSPYLQRLALQHSDDIAACLKGRASQQFDQARADFIATMALINDDNGAMQAIRIWRGRSALITAITDISGKLDMLAQFSMLTTAADTALNQTILYLFRQAAKRGKIKAFDDTLSGCGWTVLALGKMGAEELNFSSDIDLIILHDQTASPLDDAEATQPFFVSMTRDLIRLLSSASGHGIGWRVDLRLRPDPGATAVSIDIDAAIGYYESIARTWERAAFIRARPVAGDFALGQRFLTQIQPFIWRKTLDYTVMEDMKTMLRRPPQGTGWLGYNLKTGNNGIRQIEFFTHVLQLVTGGRDASLRHSNTQWALEALATGGWIETTQAQALKLAYVRLRRIEHRLQMIGDNQTHSLPRGDEDLGKFAQFMGHENSRSFCDALANLLAMVNTHAQHDLINLSDPNMPQLDANSVILLDDNDHLVRWLTDRGFTRPQVVADTVSGWMAGRIPATRSERARNILNRLLPDILDQLTAADEPDDKFAALAQFIEGLPASVQIFSLLDHNRHLTRLLCDMLLLSPHLGDQLRRRPMLFDLLLYRSFFAPLPDVDAMSETLQQISAELPVEEALDAIKRETRDWKFRIEVQALSQTIDSNALAAGLSAIATATTRIVLDLARQDMRRRHGTIDGLVSIIALGRMGTRQLTVSSDIDLLIVYDAPEQAASTGTRPLDAASYFARLAQTIISWLATPTAEGTLYEVDLRLRPEGEAGSIATSHNRLKTYFATDAWLWEKLALTKARLVAGDADLNEQLGVSIGRIVNHAHDHGAISAALGHMVALLSKNRKPVSKWHLRAHEGGILDLDLLVQGLRLAHGDLFDDTGQTSLEILECLNTTGKLKTKAHDYDGSPAQGFYPDYDKLAQASRLFNELHQSLRLTFGKAAAAPEQLPAPLQHFILTRMDLADARQLDTNLTESCAYVISVLRQFLNTPQEDF